jgi:hypothetical protein
MDFVNRCPALLIAALLASAPLFAQEKEPQPKESPPAAKPARTKLPAAYAEIESLIDSIRRTAPDQRRKHLDSLYASCGAFLEAHLDAATPDQVTLVGTTWLQLASRAADTEALARRLKQLSAHPGLPPGLDRLVQLHSARLKLKVGVTAPAWSGVGLRDGKPLHGKALEGKLVLLAFTSSRDRTFSERKLAPLFARFKGKPVFTLIDVVIDVTDAEAVTPGPGTLLSDPGQRCATAFGVASAPFLVLIGEKRKVLAIGPGWRLIAGINRLLNDRLAEQPKKDN